MTRLLIIQLMLLATPFLLFAIYRVFVGARRRALGREIDETPYQLLLFLGALASLGGLAFLTLTGDVDSHRNEFYVPARFVDGERVPARWITREQAMEEGLIRPEPEVSRDVVRDEDRWRADDEPEEEPEEE